jgi:hypothetical protein
MKPMHTWFWMRSLTRSMGAAAVFETAAETPPTDKGLVVVLQGMIRREFLSSKLGAIGSQFR